LVKTGYQLKSKEAHPGRIRLFFKGEEEELRVLKVVLFVVR
jgi:hypothetical protein